MTSSTADSVKMKDSTLVAVRTSSEAEKGEKVDVDQAERRRASNAEMGTMGFPVSSRNGHLVQFYGDRVPPGGNVPN